MSNKYEYCSLFGFLFDAKLYLDDIDNCLVLLFVNCPLVSIIYSFLELLNASSKASARYLHVPVFDKIGMGMAVG